MGRPVEEFDEELSAYSRKVGDRLRAIRRQKRLSLQDVEANSDTQRSPWRSGSWSACIRS